MKRLPVEPRAGNLCEGDGAVQHPLGEHPVGVVAQNEGTAEFEHGEQKARADNSENGECERNEKAVRKNRHGSRQAEMPEHQWQAAQRGRGGDTDGTSEFRAAVRCRALGPVRELGRQEGIKLNPAARQAHQWCIEHGDGKQDAEGELKTGSKELV